MSVIDLFSDKSDLYAAARPQYPQNLYEFVASCVNNKERVWDCGAGNGQASVAIAEYFSEVHATDISDRQIAHAIPKNNVFYSVQPAEETNFPNAYFDAVIVAQALHWFDLERFWTEVKRVLRKNGIFVAWGYTEFAISPEIDVVIKEGILDIIDSYWSPRIHLLRDGYRHVGFPFEPIPVPPIKMKIMWTLPELLAYMHTWSATRQCMQQQGMKFFEVLSDKLLAVWGKPEAKKEINMNFQAIAGRNQSE
ncbi:MAG: class I SAM-dependent methyltransferase [Waterburya sp.]